MSNKNRLSNIRYPLFSIILPAYQNQDTLNKCVDSVVLYQHSQNYEIIMVDDGSTDESRKICDEYAEQYPQSISVIHKRNEGPLLARIEGIRRARGEYLLFLDADDTYVPGMLQKTEDIIKNQKADMIIFNYYRCYKNGKSELNRPLYTKEQVFEREEKQKLYEELIGGFQLNSLWQKCIRREVLGDMKDFFQLGRMLIGEDKMLSMEAIDHADKIVYTPVGLYNYYIDRGSISHSLSLKHYEDMSIVHSRTLEYMERWKMDKYRVICYMRKVESGLSCLYSTVREVQIRKKVFSDFETLAIHIASDKAYWEAFDLCKKSLSFPKRMICILIRNTYIKTVFDLICVDDLLKGAFRKDLERLRRQENED